MVNVTCCGNLDRNTYASETHPNDPPKWTEKCYKNRNDVYNNCDTCCEEHSKQEQIDACQPTPDGGYCTPTNIRKNGYFYKDHKQNSYGIWSNGILHGDSDYLKKQKEYDSFHPPTPSESDSEKNRKSINRSRLKNIMSRKKNQYQTDKIPMETDNTLTYTEQIWNEIIHTIIILSIILFTFMIIVLIFVKRKSIPHSFKNLKHAFQKMKHKFI